MTPTPGTKIHFSGQSPADADRRGIATVTGTAPSGQVWVQFRKGYPACVDAAFCRPLTPAELAAVNEADAAEGWAVTAPALERDCDDDLPHDAADEREYRAERWNASYGEAVTK